MGIASLKNWLSERLAAEPAPPAAQPAPRPQTIQPGIALPTFQPQGASYSVQGLQPGASTFAPSSGLGILQQPRAGVAYFDPTGRATNAQPAAYTGNYMAMPMGPLEFEPLPYMQNIGGF